MYHRLGSLNNRNLFCHSSGDQKHKIKVSAELVSNLLSDKNSSHTEFGSHPVTIFELCYLFKGSIFKDIHILSY